MKKTIEEWIADYCAGTLTREEGEQLRQLLLHDPEARRFFRDAREAESLMRALEWDRRLDAREAWQRCLAAWKHRRQVRRLRRWVLSGVAAAVAVGAIVTALWIYPQTERAVLPQLAEVEQPSIAPGELKAVLSDESGQRLEITSASSSRIVAPDGTVLVNDSLEGLRYDRSRMEEQVKWQTLSVPVGGEYRFALPDGTRVWVNSASEVRFPTRFAGDLREIYMTGEVYMEVAHDARHPFVVHTGEKLVRVLGTTFNLAAYPDEQEVVATLVEGSVEFCDREKCVRLQPGEQAVLDEATGRIEKREVNTALYTSWASGMFEYENMPLEDIARQLSRWYDVQFVFDDTAFRSHAFTGVVKRTQTLEKVLSLIEKTTNVSFEITGRTVYIKRTEDAANTLRSGN